MDNLNKNINKFCDQNLTLEGKDRAHVLLKSLETLWFNTGTLCNLECINCYIESSPKNDALVYISHEEVLSYLNEVDENDIIVREIGLTGGEPFMNPDILKIIEKKLNKNIFYFKIPIFISLFVIKICEIIFFGKLHINTSQVKRLTEDKIYNYDNAKNDFFFNPRTFEEGIEIQIMNYNNASKINLNK